MGGKSDISHFQFNFRYSIRNVENVGKFFLKNEFAYNFNMKYPNNSCIF